MTRAKQVSRHCATHAADTDKANLHCVHPCSLIVQQQGARRSKRLCNARLLFDKPRACIIDTVKISTYAIAAPGN